MSARKTATRACWLTLLGALCAAGCSTPGKVRPGAEFASAGSKTGVPSVGSVKRASAEEEAEEEEKGLSFSDFTPSKIGKTTKELTGQGPNREVARQLYQEADALYRQAAVAQGDQRVALFESAAPKFVEAAGRWPDSALAMDSLFMAGESMFFADNYPKANEHYERLVKEFPNNRYLDTLDQRRFSIAKFWVDQDRENPEAFYSMNWFDKTRPWRDRRGHGLRIFDKIRIDDPTGRLADDATLAAGNENFAAGKYLKADEFYSDLRKSYPTSEHQFLAHFLGLKAKLASYMGPEYGGSALDDAEKLIKQMRRQFPVESEKEREFIDRAAAEIRFRKAERLTYLAEYYDYREEYRAAEHYYARVTKEFPDTSLATKSAERIPQIASLPPKPPQRAAWLVDLIPSTDKVKPLVEATAQIKAQEAAQFASEQNQAIETQQAANPGSTPPVERALPFFR